MTSNTSFPWPSGKRAAISLTFDDARSSQLDVGLPILNRHDIRATFYVIPCAIKEHLDDWRAAVAKGHEIGNHTLTHPCSANFSFAHAGAYTLKNITLEQMASELDYANDAIERLLGVRPRTFAYPCGQSFIGRGKDHQSYVSLVAHRFIIGRGFRDEWPNEPEYFDPVLATGIDFDTRAFDQIQPLLDLALKQGAWLILGCVQKNAHF